MDLELVWMKSKVSPATVRTQDLLGISVKLVSIFHYYQNISMFGDRSV